MTETTTEMLAIDFVLNSPAMFQLVTVWPREEADSIELRRVIAVACSSQEAFNLYIEDMTAQHNVLPTCVYVMSAQQTRRVGAAGGGSTREMTRNEYKTFDKGMHSLRNILVRDLKPESETQPAVWFKFDT